MCKSQGGKFIKLFSQGRINQISKAVHTRLGSFEKNEHIDYVIVFYKKKEF